VFKLRALGQMAMFFLRFTLFVLYFLFYAKKFVMQAVLTASSSRTRDSTILSVIAN
jgi:hypothetical protein